MFTEHVYQDDSLSTVTTGSIADDSSRCETPTITIGRRRRKVNRAKRGSASSNGARCRVQFKCTNYLRVSC